MRVLGQDEMGAGWVSCDVGCSVGEVGGCVLGEVWESGGEVRWVQCGPSGYRVFVRVQGRCMGA